MTGSPGIVGEPRGWAFLVARGRHRGYRSILAPDFLVERQEQGVLAEGAHGDVDSSGRPRVERVVTPSAGALTLAYRTHRLVPADLDPGAPPAGRPAPGGADGSAVVDQHGRPLDLLYGFVSRHDVAATVDEADLVRAGEEALRAYRGFLADEAGFDVQASAAYGLRTTMVPVPAVAPAPAPDRRAARRAAPLPSREARPARSAAWNGPAAPARPPVTRRPDRPAAVRPPAGPVGPHRAPWRVLAVGALAAAVVAVAVVLLRSPSPDIEVAGPRQCELARQGDQRTCDLRLEVTVATGASLRDRRRPIEVASDPPSGQATAEGVIWTVSPPACSPSDDDTTTCTVEVEVEAPADRDNGTLAAELTITQTRPRHTRTLQLTAR